MITVDGNGPLASGAYPLHILGPEYPQGFSLDDHPLPLGTSAYSTATRPVAPAATATATGTPEPEPCTGDCDGLGSVTINELVTAVNIALGSTDLEQCPAIDSRVDGQATVDELVLAVRHALEGCPAATALLRAAHF